MKHSEFLKGVAIVTVGSMAAKLVGALYRIPLANLLGGYGMGLYQMAYPLFVLVLTFSSTGIPSAFSRLIARETAKGTENGQTVRGALLLFSLLGLMGTLFLLAVSPLMASLQGDGALAACYNFLAPSVFFVALLAVFRGYFQGKSDMAPTAVSELIEQLVKAGAGLVFSFTAREDPARAVSYALLAVTLSEAAALLVLAVRYRMQFRPKALMVRGMRGSEVLFSALPVMAAASLLPLSHTVDSVAVVTLLKGVSGRAIALYGLFSGSALSLINLPAALSCGLASASVPRISESFARGEEEEGRRRALYALTLSLTVSVPCALGLFFLAGRVVSLLYPALPIADKGTLVTLLKLLSVSSVTLAGVETLAACLTGMGRAKYAARSMLTAVLCKFLLEVLLVPLPAFGIAGAAIAANVCYLVAFFLDLRYTVKKEVKISYDYGRRPRRTGGRAYGRGPQSTAGSGRSVGPHERAALGGQPR